jgi:hypothetical protein
LAIAPTVADKAGRDLVASATALAATLWQNANPGEVLARLYEEEPGLAHARFEFGPRMTRILDALVTGLIARAPAPLTVPGDDQLASRHAAEPPNPRQARPKGVPSS